MKKVIEKFKDLKEEKKVLAIFGILSVVLLTLSAGFGYKDFIKANLDQSVSEYDLKVRFFVILGFFWLFELFEIIILIMGYTLFINLLSLAQIFFHSIAVLLLNWFYRDVWESTQIYIPFIIGGIIPFILVIYNLIILCQSNRIISKIH